MNHVTGGNASSSSPAQAEADADAGSADKDAALLAERNDCMRQLYVSPPTAAS
jgi:hypothetical protein